jgi:hypothetical protein
MNTLPFLITIPVTLIILLTLPQLAFSQHVPPDCPVDKPVGPRYLITSIKPASKESLVHYPMPVMANHPMSKQQ